MANESNADDSHTVGIWQVNKDRLASMQQRIANMPRILSGSAGKSFCSIFKVPQSFIDINGRCYFPYIVSVGPYHHGDSRLLIRPVPWPVRPVRPHRAPQFSGASEIFQPIYMYSYFFSPTKLFLLYSNARFLGALLKRRRINLENLLRAVQPLKARSRECYSADIHFSVDEFIEILAVDGCFVIELFRKFGGIVAFEADDPLLSLSWIYSFLLRDLIRLENQIPFFVLQCLFDLTEPAGEEPSPSLQTQALRCFNNILQRSEESVEKFGNLAGKHILDLLRSSFIPADYEEPWERKFTSSHVIHCISKLRRAGIRLKAAEESFLVVRFGRGTMEMPKIAVDDFMYSFLLKCVAYEQCYRCCSKHMTTNV
ncbi:hypothetical protein SASPL_136037 [Salvia splendens]|uniref:Uncharacterized protein n=1 Tax=Salvia splendens TaxID=180675 RepID=A0A8X8X0V2_SALSN|nr:hypothetical protein SASPL_136037 [Salvia splendens]